MILAIHSGDLGKFDYVWKTQLASAGIAAKEITLVTENLSLLYDSAGIPSGAFAPWQAAFNRRVSALSPNVIICLGDSAIRAVTNQLLLKISQVQGYVFEHRQTNGTSVPVVASYSPTTIWEDPAASYWITWALRKAQELATNRAKIDSPTILNVIRQLDQLPQAVDGATPICVDIETTRDTMELKSFGFATSPSVAYVIPLTNDGNTRFWQPAEEAQIWQFIARLMHAPMPKIMQNAAFDTLVLRYWGIGTYGRIYDTLVQANYLNPELPKSLEDLGRLYCYCEPWKQLGHADVDSVTLWRYNGLDCVKTYQIHLAQLAEMRQRRLLEPYMTYVAPLPNIVYAMTVRGIKVDTAAEATARQEVLAQLEPIKARLIELGTPLVPPAVKKKKLRDKEKDTHDETGKVLTKAYKVVTEEVERQFNPASPEQVKLVLLALGYKLPTKHGKEMSDRTALLKLQRKQPSEFIELLLRHAKLAKLVYSYLSTTWDVDGRCRSSVNVGGTKSGRFSCKQTPWDTGLNIQTIPRGETPNLRNLFIPDEGKTLIQIDLSQAELRVVAWLSGDPTLCELLEKKGDVHQYVADEVTKQTGLNCSRQLGKRINHASNYGMGPNKFVDSCLLEADMVISPTDASLLLEARKKAFPSVTTWQRNIESIVRRDRRLVTPHGRERFFFGQITDETVREALSFIPQATVADYLNHIWARLPSNLEALMQGHDSLLLQVETAKLDEMLALLRKEFDAESVRIHGIARFIPYDIAVGQSWGNLGKIA